MPFAKHHAVVSIQIDPIHPNVPIRAGQDQWQGTAAPDIVPLGQQLIQQHGILPGKGDLTACLPGWRKQRQLGDGTLIGFQPFEHGADILVTLRLVRVRRRKKVKKSRRRRSHIVFVIGLHGITKHLRQAVGGQVVVDFQRPG